MIMTLCWLTISTPFVIDFQEKLAKVQKMETNGPVPSSQDEESNPPGNNTEEKVPGSNNNLTEEYMHDQHITHCHIDTENLQYHKFENAGTYIAFHGELLVPPPNAA